MEISAYEDDIFYDALGMRVWEKRHYLCDQFLTKYDCQKVNIDHIKKKNFKVLDIGCNEGKLLQRLSRDENMTLLVGLDIDEVALNQAKQNILKFLIPEPIQDQIKKLRKQQLKVLLYQGDATKKSNQLKNFNFDAITMIEIIEHIPLEFLPNLCENVFGFLHPKIIIVSTPNAEFNIYFKQIDKNFQFRHPDHKFEMTRNEFQEWAKQQALKYGYKLTFDGVSPHKNGDLTFGYCSQFAIFESINEIDTQINQNFPTEIQEAILYEQIDYPFDMRSKEQKIIDCVKWKSYSTEINDPSEIEEDFIYRLPSNQKIIRLSQLMSEEVIIQNVQNENQLLLIIQNGLQLDFQVIQIEKKNYILIEFEDQDNFNDTE